MARQTVREAIMPLKKRAGVPHHASVRTEAQSVPRHRIYKIAPKEGEQPETLKKRKFPKHALPPESARKKCLRTIFANNPKSSP